MCTETFLRLPEEKRNRFLDAAWEEFTMVPFTKASINQIIRRAGIPRGSFYQYFADKSDLFVYLMDNIREQMTAAFHGLLSEARGDFFRTALLSFDRFREQREQGSVPYLDRMVRVLRINPGMDLEHLLTGKPEEFMTEQFMADLDLSSMRRRDHAYVRRACCLAGMSLGAAIMETLLHPEQGMECRRELAGKLDMIQWGCLRDAPERGGIA